jgi:hypothetical protein
MAAKLKELQINQNKSVSQTIRIPPDEYNVIKAKAEQFANGNVSAWLRYTGKRYTPKKKELVGL